MLPAIKNIFTEIPAQGQQEFIETLLQTAHARLERIVSRGDHSPAGFWYDQEDDEWVILLKGSAGLSFAENEDVIVLHPGDYLTIRSHQRHRVAWTDPDEETVWLAVHYR